MVAVAHGPRRDGGEVGAGAGLGEALAPEIRAAEDGRQVARPLQRRSHLDQQRADAAHAAGEEDRRVVQGAFAVEQEALARAPARAAKGLRPGRGDPAALIEPPVPETAGLNVGMDAEGRAAGAPQVWCQGVVEEGADLGDEGGVVRRRGRDEG